MKKFFLHDNWEMRVLPKKGLPSNSIAEGASSFMRAKVPGSVYSCLLDSGKMPDPFWRDNEDGAFNLMENDFEFRSTFNVKDVIFNCDKAILRFDSIDTLADIYLNNKLLGKAFNQHRIWEFDVTKALIKNGKNTLSVIFHSPNAFCRAAYAKSRADGSSDCYDGFAHLRKAHCSLGWDWGPRLPDAGILRGVSLLGIEKARIKSVYITQKHAKNSVTLGFESEIEHLKAANAPSYAVNITHPDGKTETFSNSPKKIEIKNPELWWCNGFGKQNLYKIQVNLLSGNKIIDTWEKKIGLRTLTISQKKDKWGESFAAQLNGVEVFSMGADYIPEDSIFPRMNAKKTRALLEQCVLANFNSIRVWGGGFYPDDYFYDACDELGLLIWQDFMFACAVYDLTEDFEENIKSELVDNIKRLRHHPSLALWCGNNEMETFVAQGVWVSHPKQKADYIKMYEYIFPRIAREYDSERFYWPSSPSSGGSFDDANDENRGDVHYWDVWHGNKPFTEYRKFFFRYLSEFGFQSFPSVKTIETFTEPSDRNIFSYIMEKHQRNGAANGKIMNYMAQYFLYPTDFETLIYASQLLQAEAIKYGVEHFRRNRGRCMGAVYWQLNDIWPVASWASIDYFHRWKALHYYAKRFFAPLSISVAEEGMLTGDLNVNAQNKNYDKSFRLCVANETMQGKTLTVFWEERDTSGKAFNGGKENITVPALSSKYLAKVTLPEMNIHSQYISYALYEKEELIQMSSVTLVPPKFFNFENPELSFTINGDEITVSAKKYAKSVEIRNKNDDFILSDNFFDMNAGEKTVKILRGKPLGIKLRSVWDIR